MKNVGMIYGKPVRHLFAVKRDQLWVVLGGDPSVECSGRSFADAVWAAVVCYPDVKLDPAAKKVLIARLEEFPFAADENDNYVCQL